MRNRSPLLARDVHSPRQSDSVRDFHRRFGDELCCIYDDMISIRPSLSFIFSALPENSTCRIHLLPINTPASGLVERQANRGPFPHFLSACTAFSALARPFASLPPASVARSPPRLLPFEDSPTQALPMPYGSPAFAV
jgi:hypothetical protein